MLSRDITGGSTVLRRLVGRVFKSGWRVCSVLVLREGVTYEFGEEHVRCGAVGATTRRTSGPTAAAAVRSFLAEIDRAPDPPA